MGHSHIRSNPTCKSPRQIPAGKNRGGCSALLSPGAVFDHPMAGHNSLHFHSCTEEQKLVGVVLHHLTQWPVESLCCLAGSRWR